MRVVSVDSDTMRPPQTAWIRSSRLTTLVMVGDQASQHVEHLRLDGDKRLAAAQFASAGIEREVFEPQGARYFASYTFCTAAADLVPRSYQDHVKKLSTSSQGFDGSTRVRSSEQMFKERTTVRHRHLSAAGFPNSMSPAATRIDVDE